MKAQDLKEDNLVVDSAGKGFLTVKKVEIRQRSGEEKVFVDYYGIKNTSIYSPDQEINVV